MGDFEVQLRDACATDDNLAIEFFAQQLPDLPGAVTAFWPSWQRQGLLPYASFGRAWLAFAAGRVVGLGVLQHRDATQWKAFLLADIKYVDEVLPQLHERLRFGISEFAHIPRARRVQITEVIGEVLDSQHAAALNASYRANDWRPMEPVHHVVVRPTDTSRQLWRETLRRAAKSGVVVSRLKDCSAADRHYWETCFKSSALPHMTWVAHVSGNLCAMNYWTLDAQDLWTAQTTPELLHATDQEDLIARALLAAMLGFIESGSTEEWFVVTTDQDWCDWVTGGDHSDSLQVGFIHAWRFDVNALMDNPEPFQ